MKTKEIEIMGCINVPINTDTDYVIDKFIDFVEQNNWFFGGGYREIIDGHYVNEDGSLGENI
ncbi:hypothetical protein HMPREF9630_02032 [Peptoanaerobacter stomatis]|uniref:Uncharacterized protein n=1 Tax=Peptoanaerobacter stomatis TaxID=796937 RepID=V9HTY8_9FIRM|nr:hypothetical protein [Peptoanaerobacter stomatis]EHL15680.1 hypothetical protein HMPREF9630_02032 [Peptoanaerobacter stomatis]